MTHLRSLGLIRATDAESFGGKGANLGELISAGFDVPGGFVISRAGYLESMDEAGVRGEIAELHAKALTEYGDQLSDTCERLREIVVTAGMTTRLSAVFTEAYRAMGAPEMVAVRSSATGEDGADASYAGMNASYTNVRGSLEKSVVDCWASLFSVRALSYQASCGFTGEPAMAVVVQRMIRAERSGVIFTADPRTGDSDSMVIEAVFGQGETLAGGVVTPDTYVVAKDGLRELTVHIGDKTRKIVAELGGGDLTVALPGQAARRRVLDMVTVLELARLATRIETHYGRPQDVEFAIGEDGRIWFVQTRPITALPPAARSRPEPLCAGLAAAPGQASGTVRILDDPADARYLRLGEVLVVGAAGPDWMPAIERAAALVTDVGGMTCHAAVIARELGVPCVTGTGDATRVLAEGAMVTVDGDSGKIRCATTPSSEPTRSSALLTGEFR